MKIDDGFEFKSVHMEGEPYQSPMKMKILRISLEKFQVRVLDTRAFGAGRLEVKELARKAQAVAAVNGGFFQPDYRPLGLIIADGKEVNPLRNADWGIFLVQGNSPRIIHTREYLPNGNISQALQVGPRLVVNGRELQMKKQTARRSALGVTTKDKLILLNTNDTDVYAQDLARPFPSRVRRRAGVQGRAHPRRGSFRPNVRGFQVPENRHPREMGGSQRSGVFRRNR